MKFFLVCSNQSQHLRRMKLFDRGKKREMPVIAEKFEELHGTDICFSFY
jgi:hypothetical protein